MRTWWHIEEPALAEVRNFRTRSTWALRSTMGPGHRRGGGRGGGLAHDGMGKACRRVRHVKTDAI